MTPLKGIHHSSASPPCHLTAPWVPPGCGPDSPGPVQSVRGPRDVSLINRQGLLFQGASSFLLDSPSGGGHHGSVKPPGATWTVKGVHGWMKELDFPCLLACHLTRRLPHQECVFPLHCWKCCAGLIRFWFISLFVCFCQREAVYVTVCVSFLQWN